MRVLGRAVRRGLFIQSFETPNPNSVKLVPAGRRLLEGNPAEFASAQQARASPLADQLFAVPGVQRVFIAAEYVTVTKREEASWEELRPMACAALEDFLSSGKPAVNPIAPVAAAGEDSEVVALIKEIIETRVRPFVQEDGGDLLFDRFDTDTGIVWVEMQGSCTGCPSSEVTLRNGVEKMLMHYVPEVNEVRPLEDE